nr:phytanoyl-CoA dioxygenase family protein [Gammaproteobacteria bacterium]
MALTTDEKSAFERDGYLLVEQAVTADELDALNHEIAGWVALSREHTEPFGPPTVDGRPRFDMGEEHGPDTPALRRINNPSDISEAYRRVMSDARMVDMVARLVGPNVKFHHCKINLKLPGSNTEVGYHQDFAYTPHTNDDVVTALLLLDDMTSSNGCLQVVPGSHRGPVYSLFDDGTFTGVIEPDIASELAARAVPIHGRAGSVCLMHTRLAHGSASRLRAAVLDEQSASLRLLTTTLCWILNAH